MQPARVVPGGEEGPEEESDELGFSTKLKKNNSHHKSTELLQFAAIIPVVIPDAARSAKIRDRRKRSARHGVGPSALAAVPDKALRAFPG